MSVIQKKGSKILFIDGVGESTVGYGRKDVFGESSKF